MSVIGIIQTTESYAISALKRDDYTEVIACIRSLATLYNLLPAKIEVIPSDDSEYLAWEDESVPDDYYERQRSND